MFIASILRILISFIASQKLAEAAERQLILPLSGSIFGRRTFIYVTTQPRPWDGFGRSVHIGTIDGFHLWLNTMSRKKYKQFKREGRVIKL